MLWLGYKRPNPVLQRVDTESGRMRPGRACFYDRPDNGAPAHCSAASSTGPLRHWHCGAVHIRDRENPYITVHRIDIEFFTGAA